MTTHSRPKRKLNPALVWMHKMVKQLRAEQPGHKITWYAREAGRLYRIEKGMPAKTYRATRSAGAKLQKNRDRKAAAKRRAKAKRAKLRAKAKREKAREKARREKEREKERKKARRARKKAGMRVLDTGQRAKANAAARARRLRKMAAMSSVM